MPDRVFLGWDGPFLALATDWLLARKDEFPGMLVVVPTAQSGRRLREALAEQAGAILSPEFVTPGALLHASAESAAPDWLEKIAWCEVLDSIGDWSAYEGLFPESPELSPEGSVVLASEITRVRRALQEGGLTLAQAAARLRGTVEARRWSDLAKLEAKVEALLSSWNRESRSSLISRGIRLPEGVRIVLAGVPDLPPVLAQALENAPVTALIGAPESEARHFSSLGIPEEVWSTFPIEWPNVNVLADPQQQAAEAVRLAAEGGRSSDRIALGSADPETGSELERAFTDAGWTAFHPAAVPVVSGLARWFTVWNAWLADPTLAAMADLLALPETGVLVGGRRAQKALRLSELRDDWMALRSADLARRMETARFRSDYEKESAEAVLEAARSLEQWRASLLAKHFLPSLVRLLETLARAGPSTAAAATGMLEWLEEAKPFIQRLDRNAAFWLRALVAEAPAPAPAPPENRVIDVVGWLELFLEPGDHLIICGMNEGHVPARGGGEPWMGEALRSELKLTTDAARAARDAFLLTSMIRSRRDGRVDLLCGKTGTGGAPALPSRLLLLAEKSELPARVSRLFREVEPPEAGLRWHADWLWRTLPGDPPQRVNVTSLADYLRCPFRYYLKNVLGMSTPGTGRTEWDQRDFGIVTHEIMERWGRDEEARDFSESDALEAYFSDTLDAIVAGWFGENVPLSIRIQIEAMRRRLGWLADVQAAERAAGWEILSVEEKIEIPIEGRTLVAKIDRIERNNNDGRVRVLDYKTGKSREVGGAHRRKLRSDFAPPGHLPAGCPAYVEVSDGRKTDLHLWTNLQIPLYTAGLAGKLGTLPGAGYFSVGSTKADVAIREWDGFGEDDLESALDCAKWIIGRINERAFWPPAEKVDYDDYTALASGRLLKDAFEPFAPQER